MFKRCAVLLLAIVLFIAAVPIDFSKQFTAYADSETVQIKIPVSEDSYVNGGTTDSNTNYGSMPEMKVRYDSNLTYNRRAFIKFNLGAASIPGDIVKAELYVYANRDQTPSGQHNRYIYSVSSEDWSENTITYSNAPSISPIPGAYFSNTNPNTSYSWKNIDITSHIQQKKTLGAQNVSLAITGTAANSGTTAEKDIRTVSIRTKENGSNSAYLLITSTLTPSVIAPERTAQIPADGAVNVPLNTEIKSTFQTDIVQGSSFSGIKLTKGGAPVSVTVSTYKNELTVKPSATLSHGSTYQLTIPAGAVNSTNGTPLAETLVSTFSTVLNQPYVTNTMPKADALNVSLNTAIQISFNEPVYQQVYGTVELVKYGTNTPVASAISMNGQQLVVTPSVPLEYGTKYQLNVTADAIKSLYGLNLAQPTNLVFKTIGTPLSGTLQVESITELTETVARALPGAEIILANGTYSGFQAVLNANGTEANPIIIRSETPGGARFTGASGFQLSGSYLVFRDFFFDKVVYNPGHSIRIVAGNHIRITGNYFYQCGDTNSPFIHIIRIDSGSQYNRVDHNTMEDSRGQGIGVKISSGADQLNLYNTIDHNFFRNIRFVGDWFNDPATGLPMENGIEAVQIGQGSNSVRSYTTVEYNLFENVMGDKAEIISNKSSNNTIRYNTFLNSWSGPTNRLGNSSVFTGNFFFNGKDGIRNYGGDQIISNNYFFNVKNTPISVPSGSDDHDLATNTKIVNNTLIYSGDTSSIQVSGGTRGAEDTLIANNLVATNRTIAINNSPISTEMKTNAVYAWGNGTVGSNVPSVLREDVGLERNGLLYRPAAGSKVVDYGTLYPSLPLSEDMDGQKRVGNPDAGADEMTEGGIIHRPLSIMDVGPEDKWWVPANYYALGMILWNGVPVYGFRGDQVDYAVTLPGGTTSPPTVEALLWEGSRATLQITQPTSVTGKGIVKVLDLNGNVMKTRDLNGHMVDAVFTIQFSANSDQTQPITSLQTSAAPEDGWYPSGVTVSFSATDAESGVSRVEYRLDNSPTWSTYNEAVVIPNGIHLLEYRGIDKAGNVEDTRSQTFQVGTITDINPPVGQLGTIGNSSVQLSWSPVAGSVSYAVYASTSSGSRGSILDTFNSAVYSYQATGLTNGVTYYFTIAAVLPYGDVLYSNSLDAMPMTVPGAPTHVSASYHNGGASVTFSAPDTDGGSSIIGYEVTVSPGGATALGVSSPIEITGLSNGSTYTFTVKAKNAVGLGAASAASNSVTLLSNSSGKKLPMAKVRTVGNSSVQLSWNPVVGSVSYVVYASTSSGSLGSVLSTVDSAVYSYEATELTNGVTYYFTIAAVLPSGEVLYSHSLKSKMPEKGGKK
ncbi:chondroitinase-B domain-containing protein [Paenibacillus qinlingensis]|uniref:Methionine-rich copper-binding protein CopC n=1 Tax=Paenibacillus qinlingensis TaxID=1837343 RepID=A0ABU1NWP1_9BACL|nr:chondroitinase-B domain-containing protein [Paenibacillus qinlingensis]MDR6551855.1 methionine-rich copper-binding protein CopC [Paenibacillus qinlingensis]